MTFKGNNLVESLLEIIKHYFKKSLLLLLLSFAELSVLTSDEYI